jgi:transposase
MKNAENVEKLKSYLRKLKKQKLTPIVVRTILRVKALIAYYKGQSVATIAECYDTNEKTIKKWVKIFEGQGCDSLPDIARSGRPVKLPEDKQQELKKIIEEQDQRIWVARHVYILLVSMFDITYSIKYIPEFLRKLGLTFHKAVHHLIKKDSSMRRKWIQEQLPLIYKKQIKEGWRVFYQDEVGIQTEGTLGYTWGPKGQKIEIENYGRHGRMNIIGAFELGTGYFYGMLTSFKVNAQRFRRFICHLKHEMRTDKILLICDNASFHKAKWLTKWVSEQASWIKLEFLPAYSPDFNPIERFWRWLKTDFTHNKCWKTKEELKKYLAKILKQEIPSSTYSIKDIMKKENERFKEISKYYEVEPLEQFKVTA